MTKHEQITAEEHSDDYIDIYRLKIRNDPKVITPRMYQVLSAGRYEKSEAMLARKFLTPEDTLLEFGSGLGIIAAIALRRAKVKRVISIEANPDLHPIIEDTMRTNNIPADRFELIYGAVSVADSAEPLTFHRRHDFWGSSLSPTPGRVVSTEEVPCINPAPLIAKHKPTVIFSDIEGAELDVFPNLDLTALRAVVVEIHPRVYGSEGVIKLFEAMHAKGFVYTKQSSGTVVVFQKA